MRESTGINSAKDGETGEGLTGAVAPGCFQKRAKDSPGNGGPPPWPTRSTIVAAMSRRLTASLTVRVVGLPRGGMNRSGTCNSVS